MNSFTYIIRSDSKYSGTLTNCQIQLRGLPTKYKSFQVEVIGFVVNIVNINGNFLTDTAFLELTSDNLQFIDGYDTKNNKYKTVANTVCNSGNTIIYKVNNFNGQYINFNIVDTLQLDHYIYNWYAILKMTGIDE